MISVGILTCLPQVFLLSYNIFVSLSLLDEERLTLWYSLMNVSDPVTNVFATTTRDHPIHLWDATSGQVLFEFCLSAFVLKLFDV